jgi:hypothetical protein
MESQLDPMIVILSIPGIVMKKTKSEQILAINHGRRNVSNLG